MKICKKSPIGNIFKLKFPTNVKDNNHEFPIEKIKEDLNLYNDNNGLTTKSNNMCEDLSSNILKKDTMDFSFQDGLKEEMINIKMSYNLRESILHSTIKKPKSIYEKFSEVLNRTVEIPIFYICTVSILIFISSTLSTFIVTDNMKMHKKLQGYTNIRVLNISGSNVILPKDIREVTSDEKN